MSEHFAELLGNIVGYVTLFFIIAGIMYIIYSFKRKKKRYSE